MDRHGDQDQPPGCEQGPLILLDSQAANTIIGSVLFTAVRRGVLAPKRANGPNAFACATRLHLSAIGNSRQGTDEQRSQVGPRSWPEVS